jgi:hypothetical protein
MAAATRFHLTPGHKCLRRDGVSQRQRERTS